MTPLVARAARAAPPAALALLGLFALAGCVDPSLLVKPCAAPHASACQMVATWYPEVLTTPDPAHGGLPVCGLAGRVWLFGPEVGAPVVGDGSVVVDLYDETPGPRPKDATPVPLEEWRFDRDTLKRLQKQDAVGWGYTLFLPWSTYRPEITHVRLMLRYAPVTGSPLFNDSATVVLRKGESASWQTTDIPALREARATPTEARGPSAPSAPGGPAGAVRPAAVTPDQDSRR
jgi:hypothetical protein